MGKLVDSQLAGKWVPKNYHKPAAPDTFEAYYYPPVGYCGHRPNWARPAPSQPTATEPIVASSEMPLVESGRSNEISDDNRVSGRRSLARSSSTPAVAFPSFNSEC